MEGIAHQTGEGKQPKENINNASFSNLLLKQIKNPGCF
jgi:hypothetical protein